MKKLLLIIIGIALSFQLSAQGFTFGPLIGFNSSSLTTNIDTLTNEAKANFLFGAFIRMGKKIYIQPELVWTTKGGILINTDVSNLEAEMQIKMKQIEIPVLVGWRLINFGIGNIRIMGGPAAGIVMDKTVTANDLVKDPIPETSLKDLVWSAQLGAGVDVLFLSLDIRYEFGLSNIYNGSESYNMKNNLWRFSLAWTIL